MDASDTTPPATTGTASASSPDVESSEKPSECTSPAVEATTSVTASQSWPSPDSSKAAMLHCWVKRSIVAQTHLQEDVAALIAFWVLSTWFQEALTVRPCLLITGAAHDAMVILRILEVFCRIPVRVAEFRRGDLETLNRGYQTLLMLEPNLDNRKAALLGNLTNSGFGVVAKDRYLDCSKSRAIYIGTNPATQEIQNAINITIAPTNAEPPRSPTWLQQVVNHLPGHLANYRQANLNKVRLLEFIPSGVPGETAAIAKALGNRIVDAPELQEKLIDLMKAQGGQQLTQRSGTDDGLIVEAVLVLSRQKRDHVYTSEIRNEANRLVELRGERPKLSPETVGRRLCQLGLRTHRLTKAGNGLTFDTPTVALIQQLAAVYVEEDRLPETENFHRSQTT